MATTVPPEQKAVEMTMFFILRIHNLIGARFAKQWAETPLPHFREVIETLCDMRFIEPFLAKSLARAIGTGGMPLEMASIADSFKEVIKEGSLTENLSAIQRKAHENLVALSKDYPYIYLSFGALLYMALSCHRNHLHHFMVSTALLMARNDIRLDAEDITDEQALAVLRNAKADRAHLFMQECVEAITFHAGLISEFLRMQGLLVKGNAKEVAERVVDGFMIEHQIGVKTVPVA